MTRVEGLVRRNKATLSKIMINDDTPVQLQLLAGREDQLEKFLSTFTPFDGFKGFNLNLSCPSLNVVQAGRGCAMVKRVSKTQRLVEIIQKHNYPVSLKLRLGTNAYEKSHKVYLNAIKGVNADFFVVHAKTGSQNSDEPSDSSVYPECVDAANGKPIIANGDVDSKKKVLALKEMKVSGVMIGRGAMKNPAIFDYLKNECGFNPQMKRIPSLNELKQDYFVLAREYNGPLKYRENLVRELGSVIPKPNRRK